MPPRSILLLLTVQLPGLRFNIFLDEVVLDSDRRIQFCPVGKAVANVRYMGKVVKEGSPPGFLWLKFHSARNRKGVLELPVRVCLLPSRLSDDKPS